jgi:hypothetical protein
MAQKPASSKIAVLAQICKLIPAALVARLAAAHGVDKKARTFCPLSHIVAMLLAQLTRASSLNDVCDNARIHQAKLNVLGVSAPSRNGLAHANKVRSAAMAEALFWGVLEHLTCVAKGFGGRTYQGMTRRMKRTIHVIDSSTIQLVANCLDWARHKRSKAGVKVHLRLDLKSFLPSMVLIDTARPHDNKYARELCAAVRPGEVVLFDKAYVDFGHLFDMTQRGVWWVTRAKDNLQCRVKKRLLRKPQGKIVRDDLIVLIGPKVSKKYPQVLRRVVAWVEVDGQERLLEFLTNHLEWAASTIVDLYKSRWAIEAFFKQLKQTLQLCDFLGHTKNAIQWQIWMGLLTYLLLRFLAWQHDWSHSFNRIVAIARAALWSLLDLGKLLAFYGTADGDFRLIQGPAQLYLPGFGPLGT